MEFALNALKNSPSAKKLFEAVEGGRTPLYITGICEIYKLILTATLCENRRGFLLLPDGAAVDRVYDLLCAIIGQENILRFDSRDNVFYKVENMSRKAELDRIRTIDKIRNKDYKIAVITADALMQRCPDPSYFERHSLTINSDESYDMEELALHLVNCGYASCELTEVPGQFSKRGGILEFFSPAYPNPVRIEFFGDDIDSICFYDKATQRRIENIESAKILPVLEVIADKEANLKITELLRKQIKKLKEKSEEAQNCASDIEAIENKRFPSIDRYLPFTAPICNILEHDKDAFVFCYDLSGVKNAFKGYEYRIGEDLTALANKGIPLCEGDYYNTAPSLLLNLEQRGLILLEDFLRQENDIAFKYVDTFKIKRLSPLSTDAAIVEEIGFYKQKGFSVAFFAGSPTRASALPSLLEEHRISSVYMQTMPKVLPENTVCIFGTSFPEGYEDTEAKFALMGSGRLGITRKRKSRYEKGEKISSFNDIKVGDYIVHANYGIGIYDGVHKVENQGVIKDFIRIKYAGTDALFIPCGQFDQITKYVGASVDMKVKLNKLGTGEWARAKSRVSANVKDLAKQLIKLYSERQQAPGHAFSKDSEWQREFELSFDYEETEDQRRCCEEIKADMERKAPMDRLLCGDVGFGKTEVALRAAFKCVLDGKQVAILVPTTILAWQHYNTIIKRMGEYPVTVELLSRFRNAQQQEKITGRLRRGEIDIVVGTHRLIQKDVKFKDLGLLIIDEEQRFGVAHKENLKEMFKNVDVLTLTATPIPRTLNMAMSGIRDMSVIEEPPMDRHPVSSYVCEYDEGIVVDAMRREIARGGQCYYLYNRVETIFKVASRLQNALPDANIEVAHGKMSKDELSAIWERMLEGDIDILICTTIIETGVDVPNANTLIIEDADRLGLAQLHQIRGRVGRSYKHAYAYFTYRKGKSLSEDSRRRLEAIREYTEFGSGFKIAMRDLQIRGAGNLLGAQQHGHMDSVGYDMYMQLLSQAIAEQKGEIKIRPAECAVDFNVNAYIPEEYIASSTLRVDIYKKIALVENDNDKQDLIDELCDRFSEPPKEVLDLIDIALIRAYGAELQFTEIAAKDGYILIYLKNNDIAHISHIVSLFKGKMFFNASSRPYLSYRTDAPVETALMITEKLMEDKKEK